MKNLKVVSIDFERIKFDDGSRLESFHAQDCCEHHWLSFEDLTLEDFDGLEFDLSNDNFFERVPNYGIRLKPVNGFPVSVPGYSSNNGYYSSHLELVLNLIDGSQKTYDITECQNY